MRDSERFDRLVDELREPVAVRAAWREALLQRVSASTPPSPAAQPVRMSGRARTRWSLHSGVAVGAAAAGLVLGTVLGVTVDRARVVRRDVATHRASALLVGSSTPVLVHFAIVAPRASRVALVGNFNGWNPASLPMHRSRDGQRWLVDAPLPPGRYVYAFVVDGDIVTDPTAPQSVGDDFGVPNAVLLVDNGAT